MANPSNYSFLMEWGDDQLLQLVQAAADVLSQRGRRAPSTSWDHKHVDYNGSFLPPVVDPYTTVVRDPERSNTGAKSTYSGETTVFDASDLSNQTSGYPLEPNPLPRDEYDVTFSIETNGHNTLSNIHHQEGIPQFASTNSETGTTPKEGKAQPADDELSSTVRRFFCTFCYELKVPKTFKTKHDWKRHEKEFHETGEDWTCQDQHCPEVFPRERDLKQHCLQSHGRKDYPHDGRRKLPAKRAYACGFTDCRQIFTNWKDRCDHVGRHMRKGDVSWDYSSRIRMLLRHRDIAAAWKQVRSHFCDQTSTSPNDLRWEPKTSRNVRQQLEFCSYGPNRDDFLAKVFWKGHPKHHISTEYHLPPMQPQSFPVGLALDEESVARRAATSYLWSPPLAHSRQQPTAPPEELSRVTSQNTFPRPQARNSIVMLDAPPASEIQEANIEDDQNIGYEDDGLCTPYEFANTTPPLPEMPPTETTFLVEGNSRTSPGRKLVRKSREWLSSKRSQHFTPPLATNHPDLSPGFRLPSSHAKATNTLPPASFNTPPFYSYHFQ